jgi:hypothetical protein
MFSGAVQVPPGGTDSATVKCIVNEWVLTGGGHDVEVPPGASAPSVLASHPTPGGAFGGGWVVKVQNTQAGAGTVSIKSFISCAY